MEQKQDGRTRHSVRNVSAGLIHWCVNMLLPFVSRSIIIHVLGTDYLGLNSLFSSILNVLNVTELGFSSAITYKMYEPVSRGDIKRLSQLLTIYRILYRCVGIVILVSGMLVLPFLPHFIKGSYPEEINIYVIYAVYLLNSAASYLLYAYKGALLSAYQRMDIQSMISACMLLLMNCGQILVLLFVHSYYSYIILMPVFTVLNNLAVAAAATRLFPDVVDDEKVRKEDFFYIMRKSGAMFGHKLNYVIVTSADNIVISAFLGLTVLAKYTNYFTILSAVIGVIDTVTRALLPSVGSLVVEQNHNKINRIFYTLSFLQFWLVGWCCICLVCLYQPFMTMWMGEHMLLDMQVVILLALYLYSYKSRAVVLLFKEAAGMWEDDLLKPYVSAICNIALNLILVKQIGIYGVILSTIVSFSTIHFPWETSVVMCKIVKQPFHCYAVFLLRNLFLTVGAGIAAFYFCGKINSPGFAGFLGRVIICLIVPNVFYGLAVYRTREFKDMRILMKQSGLFDLFHKNKNTAGRRGHEKDDRNKE